MDYTGHQYAYIGDAVWTLLTRKSIIEKNVNMGKDSNVASNRYCSASAQANFFNQLNEINFFNEKELLVYKKGRNIKVTKPGSHNIGIYRVASGFEAVIGYLYLHENHVRIQEIWDKVEAMEME